MCSGRGPVGIIPGEEPALFVGIVTPSGALCSHMPSPLQAVGSGLRGAADTDAARELANSAIHLPNPEGLHLEPASGPNPP